MTATLVMLDAFLCLAASAAFVWLGGLLWRGARRRARDPREACGACGYDRAGLAAGSRCPECGSTTVSAPGRAWASASGRRAAWAACATLVLVGVVGVAAGIAEAVGFRVGGPPAAALAGDPEAAGDYLSRVARVGGDPARVAQVFAAVAGVATAPHWADPGERGYRPNRRSELDNNIPAADFASANLPARGFDALADGVLLALESDRLAAPGELEAAVFDLARRGPVSRTGSPRDPALGLAPAQFDRAAELLFLHQRDRHRFWTSAHAEALESILVAGRLPAGSAQRYFAHGFAPELVPLTALGPPTPGSVLFLQPRLNHRVSPELAVRVRFEPIDAASPKLHGWRPDGAMLETRGVGTAAEHARRRPVVQLVTPVEPGSYLWRYRAILETSRPLREAVGAGSVGPWDALPDLRAEFEVVVRVDVVARPGGARPVDMAAQDSGRRLPRRSMHGVVAAEPAAGAVLAAKPLTRFGLGVDLVGRFEVEQDGRSAVMGWGLFPALGGEHARVARLEWWDPSRPGVLRFVPDAGGLRDAGHFGPFWGETIEQEIPPTRGRWRAAGLGGEIGFALGP